MLSAVIIPPSAGRAQLKQRVDSDPPPFALVVHRPPPSSPPPNGDSEAAGKRVETDVQGRGWFQNAVDELRRRSFRTHGFPAWRIEAVEVPPPAASSHVAASDGRTQRPAARVFFHFDLLVVDGASLNTLTRELSLLYSGPVKRLCLRPLHPLAYLDPGSAL